MARSGPAAAPFEAAGGRAVRHRRGPGEERGAPTKRQKDAGDAMCKGADAIGDFLKSSSGRALTREVVRGMFGMLKTGL